MSDSRNIQVKTSAAGTILSLVSSGQTPSRADLIARSGLSRTTVTQHLAMLLEAGLIREASETIRSGGRPTRQLQIEPGFGIILAVDVGESHARLAVTDLLPRVLAETQLLINLQTDPSVLLDLLLGCFGNLLDEIGRTMDEVLGLGLGLPAPVDYPAGRVTGPSIMPAWEEFDIAGWFAARTTIPVLVENDVNLMSLSEAWEYWPDITELFFVKAGTGIGSGIVTNGQLYRGAQGAAGDIGHIQLLTRDPPRCRCGKLGCVEARAAGWAIARALQAKGIDARTPRDIVSLVHGNDPLAIQLICNAGHVFGEAIAAAVSVLNPSVIVIGGTLAQAGEPLLSGIRECVFQRSLPLATRNLRIVKSQAGVQAGILGAARLVFDQQMRPAHVDRTIALHARRRRPAPGNLDIHCRIDPAPA